MYVPQVFRPTMHEFQAFKNENTFNNCTDLFVAIIVSLRKCYAGHCPLQYGDGDWPFLTATAELHLLRSDNGSGTLSKTSSILNRLQIMGSVQHNIRIIEIYLIH
jgi:hypothetical protein